MKIRFIGPLGKVTGSCTWMRDEINDWNFLVDCGMQQGERTAAEWNACDWPFNPADIRFVVLTHAHIDHCGLIPVLYKKGFTGLVYCSRETAEIAKVLLRDAAAISDVGFTAADVDAVRWHEPLRPPLFGRFHPVDHNLFLRFYRSGHVVGAVSVAVYWGAPGPEQRSIVFSGDLGPNSEDTEGLPFLRHRMNVGTNDFAVIESTYGATVRRAEQCYPEYRRVQLRGLLDRALEQRGTLVIPAFSLGRVQDVLFDLHWIVAEDPERYATIAFHLDAPSARKMGATLIEAMRRTESNGKRGKVRPLWLGKQMFRWFGLDDSDPEHANTVMDICRMTLSAEAGAINEIPTHGNAIARAWRPLFRVIERRNRQQLAVNCGASVLVVSSGSCDGGPAAWWLPKLLASTGNTIALAGYCSAGTVGSQLMSLGEVNADERRRLTGELVWPTGGVMPLSQVGAKIVSLQGYSAHADQAGLLEWVIRLREGRHEVAGRAVFIQHGGDAQRKQLAAAIETKAALENVNVHPILPDDPNTWFDLSLNALRLSEEECLQGLENEIARLSRELAKRRHGGEGGLARR